MREPLESTVDTTVLMPRSARDAVTAFRDGETPTVVGGGTIVVPDAHSGRVRPRRALVLTRAGMDTITRSAGTVTIGAAVTLDRLAGTVEPLGAVAAGVADLEVRAQATIGGNLCARSTDAVPRGDLQVPLIALGARVHVATPSGEQTLDVAEFLAGPAQPRLVLALDVDDRPRRTGTARLARPHTHSYTVLHVCAVASLAGGRLTEVRIVAGGLGDGPVRLSGVEAELDGGALDDATPDRAAGRAMDGVTARTDSLASAWYRSRVLPSLVRRALRDMLDGGEDS